MSESNSHIETYPEKIYLQSEGDNSYQDELFGDFTPELTWCADKMNEADVGYIRADVVHSLNAELVEALENIENDDNHIPKKIWDMRNAVLRKTREVTDERLS